MRAAKEFVVHFPLREPPRPAPHQIRHSIKIGLHVQVLVSPDASNQPRCKRREAAEGQAL